MSSPKATGKNFHDKDSKPNLSLFLPVFNEEENLPLMHETISNALETLNKTAEIIYVDDGSIDKSIEILRDIAKNDKRVRVVSFRRKLWTNCCNGSWNRCCKWRHINSYGTQICRMIQAIFQDF